MSPPDGWIEAIERPHLLCEAQAHHPDAATADRMFGEPLVSVAIALHEPDPDDGHRFTGKHATFGAVMSIDQAEELARNLLSAVECSRRCFAQYQSERN